MVLRKTDTGLQINDQGHFEGNWIIVESDKLDQYVEFIQNIQFRNFMGVVISRDLGYSLQNLNFLLETPHVRGLWLSDPLKDISGMEALGHLRVLRLAENNYDLRLSRFPTLRELGYDWHKGVTEIDACKELEVLTIGSFKPRNDGFVDLPVLPRLRRLKVVGSTIHSVDGIDKFSVLEKLELYYCSQLSSIAGLQCCSELRSLELDTCRKLADHDAVQFLQKLEMLRMSNCGAMPSISFITKMRDLQHLSFVDTTVLDGDLTPIREHPTLRYAGFMDKRHYNIKYEVLEKHFEDRRTGEKSLGDCP